MFFLFELTISYPEYTNNKTQPNHIHFLIGIILAIFNLKHILDPYF